MKKDNNRGFTLIEIIIAVAILAILIGIAVPMILGHVNKTKATVCSTNRKALEDAYVLQRAMGLDTSMNELLANADGKYFEQTPACPSGGVYSWDEPKDKDTVPKVHCSVHDDEQESGGGESSGGETDQTEEDPQGKLPGTNVNLSSSYWPTQEEINANTGTVIYVDPGKPFMHTDGNYYAVYKRTDAYSGDPNPQADGVVKIDHSVIYNSQTAAKTFPKGALYEDNQGNVYVCTNSEWADLTSGSNPGRNWYKISN